jgi:hypothetical protein
VPETLWNTKHILPRGVVCDLCNNYFAREVEKPFLDSPAVSLLRFEQAIPNKRGRIPEIKGMMLPGYEAIARRYSRGPFDMSIELSDAGMAHILGKSSGTLIFPASGDPPKDRVVARFLAKMALEAMAQRLLSDVGALDYLVDEAQLDDLRKFARMGVPQEWPYSLRRIYPPNGVQSEANGTSTQTVHEFDFLVTASSEWYFVFALFGLEIAINLGGPEVDGYLAWLDANDGVSPLYFGKNSSPVPR